MVVRLLLILWHLCASLAMSMPSSDHMITGSCACGSIQFQVQGVTTETSVVDCHCPECRQHHVSAFSTYLVAPEDSVTIEGDSMTSVKDNCGELGEVDRLFCKECYSKVATKQVSGENDKKLMVCLGSLDDDSIPDSLNESWKKDRTEWQQNSAAKWPKALPRMTRHGLPTPLSVTGSCACGDCAYEIPFVPPMELQHCYCKLCRQLSGSAFQTWVPVYHENFVWTTPEPALVRTTQHGRRHVCRKCGGVLTIVYDSDPDCVWPAAGGFNDATLPDEESKVGEYLDRVIHICCIWKQPWYQLPEDGMKRIDYAG